MDAIDDVKLRIGRYMHGQIPLFMTLFREEHSGEAGRGLIQACAFEELIYSLEAVSAPRGDALRDEPASRKPWLIFGRRPRLHIAPFTAGQVYKAQERDVS